MKELSYYPLLNTPYYDPNRKWVSPYNFIPEAIAGFPKTATIYDVTLRDGEQQSGVTFLEDERVRIAEALAEMGVPRIEACMPVVSKTAVNALRRINNANLPCKVYAFARTHPKDIQIAIDAGAKYLNMEHSVNPYTCEYVYNLDMNALADRFITCIKKAKDAGLHISFMGWDFSRAPMDFTMELYKRVFAEARPDGLVLVDTYSCTTPYAAEYAVRKFQEAFPDIELEWHVHNDFGLGVASSLAALRGGARVIHCAMTGMGERTGNASTEEIACALELLLNIDTGIDLTQLTQVANLISTIAKKPISDIKAIVGKRIFALESGVGVHINRTMQSHGIELITLPISNKAVGGPEPFFILGKNSGNITIEYFLDKYGFEYTDDQVQEINEMVKNESLLLKDVLTDDQFLAIARQVIKD